MMVKLYIEQKDSDEQVYYTKSKNVGCWRTTVFTALFTSRCAVGTILISHVFWKEQDHVNFTNSEDKTTLRLWSPPLNHGSCFCPLVPFPCTTAGKSHMQLRDHHRAPSRFHSQVLSSLNTHYLYILSSIFFEVQRTVTPPWLEAEVPVTH